MNGTKHTNPKDIIGSGKVPLELVPDTARVAAAMAFLEGAAKYGRYNWRLAGVRASIYRAALDRHLVAWWNGEDVDPDSGLPHLWKALACLAILIDAEECDKLTDDRPPALPMHERMADLAATVDLIKARHADKSPYQYTIADTEPRPGEVERWAGERAPEVRWHQEDEQPNRCDEGLWAEHWDPAWARERWVQPV